MASSSSSSSHRIKYQVFLSFRGTDTRHNFTRHLLEAMEKEKISVFFDEKKLEKGEKLNQALKDAIAASKLSIIVLSEDYASSKSCMAELSDIMDRKRTQGHIVHPIFYKVDRSHVQNIDGSFKVSFEKHQSKMPSEEVKRWKTALADVAIIKGCLIKGDEGDRLESEHIKDIVKFVIRKLTKHQVFFSSGEKTRLSFTSHLLDALKIQGINVVFDDGNLIGKSEAIATSDVSLIVLSDDYAFSESCLAEVSDIMGHKKTQENYIVLPIFYKVDPSDVRNIGGGFKTAFDGHQPKELHQVQLWKSAFKEVGQLKGWHIEGGNFDRSEHEYIEDIAKYVIEKLNSKSRSVSEGLVGIDEQKDTILVMIEKNENHIIGLLGLGGSGKTTLAEVVYNELCPMFDVGMFVQNVREKIEKQGMESLRNELLSKLLNSKIDINTRSISSTIIQDRLKNRRVMVVFDDVSDSNQIVDMGIQYFGTGSKIIVTCREKQKLENVGAHEIHKVEMLNENASLQLFSSFAFKQLNPAVEFRDLSRKVLNYAQGSPLALKVLGSLLYKKPRGVWESEMAKLKEYAKPEISLVLKRSFDGLDEVEKDIFLDIATILKGKPREEVKAFLCSCYEGAESGISSLLDKCLIEITTIDIYKQESHEQHISMHDMLEEMGKDIARKESKIPRDRRWLWNPKDVLQVLKDNRGTESIEAIMLDMGHIDEIRLCPTVFENMHNLRYINFHHPWTYGGKKKLCAGEVDIVSLPDELRYIEWDYYPFKSLSSRFNPKNLIGLKLYRGDIEQLWNEEDHQALVHLREIGVYGCEKLRKIPNLSTAKKLEILDCFGCYSLIELPSFSHLSSLKTLNLSWCSKLRKIPDLSTAKKLEILDCSGCQSLVELPSLSHLSSLKTLNVSECEKLGKIPDLSTAKKLEILKCNYCESLVELPSLSHLPSLKTLNVSRCSILVELPCLNRLASLKELNLSYCSSLVELPCLNHLASLESFSLNECKNLRKIPDLSGAVSLKILKCERCISLVELPCLNHLASLEELHLRGCSDLTKIPDLSGAVNLKFLNCNACSNLKEITTADVSSQILSSKSLCVLDIEGCKPYTFEMIFGNCFSLNQDSIDNIEANTMLRIRSLAEKIVRENAEGPRELLCCFPSNLFSASKFEYHSVNSGISLKLSPNECGGSRFLAFSVYLVVDLKNCDKYWLNCTCEYTLTTTGGAGHETFESMWTIGDAIAKREKDEGNHVLILFSEDMVKKDRNYEEASFHFFIKHRWNIVNPVIEMKNCGVNVLYVDEEPSLGLNPHT